MIMTKNMQRYCAARKRERKMAFDPKKYTVTKDGVRLDDDTYFVIRRGDILAVPSLSAYRQSIMSLIDLDNGQMTEAQKEHLLDIACVVDEKANRWSADNGTRRIPD